VDHAGANAWGDVRLEASRETGIGFDRLPGDCPWSANEVRAPAFWPAELKPPELDRSRIFGRAVFTTTEEAHVEAGRVL